MPDAPSGVHAWFDGACEPVNPGGVGTWAFVVRDGQELLATRHGRVAEVPGQAMTNNWAEYIGLLMLAEWLRDHGHDEGRVHGDSKIVISQVKGEMKANAEHLRRLRDLVRAALPPDVELVHVMRESNGEADALTHRAYVEALRTDEALRQRFAPEVATAAQLAALQRQGVPTYPFMGKREASRLLSRAKAGQSESPASPN